MSDRREKGGQPLLQTNQGVPLKEWLKRADVPVKRGELWNLMIIFEQSRAVSSPWKRFVFRVRRRLAKLNPMRFFREEGIAIPKDVPISEEAGPSPFPVLEGTERKVFDASGKVASA